MVVKKEGLYFVISIILILTISFTSANIFDSIKNLIYTGKASSQPTNVSVVVVGVNPVNINVYVPDQTPVENNTISVDFYPVVSDIDGFNDIDLLSVSAFVSRGSTTKSTACTFETNINATSVSFLCSINMYYWEESGSWNVRVQGKDIGNGTMMNGTTTFYYGELKGLLISPTNLNWPALVPLATNQNASNDPTIVSNTGNYAGAISITAKNLTGETNPSERIPAINFRVGVSGSECTGGTQLADGTTPTTILANPGNLSAGAGQANIYYCITQVPSVSSQTYSTLAGGSWSVLY